MANWEFFCTFVSIILPNATNAYEVAERRRILPISVMTIIKEIRGVAIQRFLPSGMDLMAWLDNIEAKRHKAVIRYQKDNPCDSTCMVISVDDVDVCFVNADDKRFVKPLIEQSGCEECEADFLEVYRPENGTPILRYTVVVDLEDVEKIEPGEEWSNWDYNGPQLLSIGKINNAEHYANAIKKAIARGTDGICDATARLINEFVEATLIDMSIETTKLYDDLVFLLETRQRSVWREYIEILQHASTVRRKDCRRKAFIENWWPEFLEGEAVNRLCQKFAAEIAREGKMLGGPVIAQYLEELNITLRRLPYDLYMYVDSLKDLWSVVCYTHIPREKFHKLLSALALRDRLQRAVDGKMPLIVNNLTMNNKTELNFLKDSNAVVNTY